jgi:hypothetical protein
MADVLQTSRIPLLIVPIPVVVEAAVPRGVVLGPAVTGQLNVLLAFLRTARGRPILKAAAEIFLSRSPQWHTADDFFMQKQEQDNWCWAAVGASIASTYDAATTWTQCALANKELPPDDCCTNGDSAACDVDNSLTTTLTTAGVLRLADPAKAAFPTLQAELNNERPVCWRILWNGGGGHFAVIYSWAVDAGTELLAIADPKRDTEPIALTMAQLDAGHYRGGGTWTHTYFTQP